MRGSKQILVAVLWLIAAVVVPIIALYAIGIGRDAWLAASLSAACLVLIAMYLTGARRFRLGPMVAALALCEGLLVLAIGLLAYGGTPRMDAFFVSWFGGVGMMIATAWCGGVLIGRRFRGSATRR